MSSSVLVGLFESQGAAEQARAQLLSAGFAEAVVSLTGGASSSSPSNPASSQRPAKGTIAHFFESLFGGIATDAEAGHSPYSNNYHEAFQRGSYGVTVTTADDDEIDRAESILNAAGAVDIDEKAAQWRETGAVSSGSAASTAATSLEAGATRKLQEVEEELKVGKRVVARGGVRIFSRVLEVPVEESVTLREEHANVQRRVVDRPATEADFAAFEEGSFELRETAEEAVISKTARVTGEVEIGKTATEHQHTVRDTVRKTQVDIEPLTGGSATGRATVGGLQDRAIGVGGGSANRDPLTGEPGAHPVGTALGAAAGGMAAGAAIGTVAGPVGTVVGAAVGAVAGGGAGKGVAEKVDPTAVIDHA